MYKIKYRALFLQDKIMNNIYLGVNIDHVATVRNARGGTYPDPVSAAAICEIAGADSITTHLREDRRHITDRDVRIIRQTIQTKLNLEMAVTDDILGITQALAPQAACFVPERREEVTTEGGLDVVLNFDKISKAVVRLNDVGTKVSLFIDPDKAQIDAAKKTGAPYIELHTGAYANATSKTQLDELKKIDEMAHYAASIGLKVNAGHGLSYNNVAAIAAIDCIEELNIGHSIISKAIFVGLEKAVKEMKELIIRAREQYYIK